MVYNIFSYHYINIFSFLTIDIMYISEGAFDFSNERIDIFHGDGVFPSENNIIGNIFTQLPH